MRLKTSVAKNKLLLLFDMLTNEGAIVKEFGGFCHADNLSSKGLALLLQNHYKIGA